VIRNVVVHIANEQPIVVDIVNDPKPSDVALICSNVRTMGGKKPVFIDKSDSTFVMPLASIRFVEMPQASMAEAAAARAEVEQVQASVVAERGSNEESGMVAGPLARLDWLTGVASQPTRVESERPEDEPARNPDELDPELLRRIHEV
jgi:hypothetical protein